MATVKFHLRRPREKGKLKNTEVSIYLKCTVDKQNRFELNTREKIAPVFWNFKTQEVKPSYRRHLEINQSLAQIKNDIFQLWKDNKTLSVEELREMARPLLKFGTTTTPQKKSLFPVFLNFLQEYRKDKDEKTAKKYEALYHEREGKKGGRLWEFNPKLTINGLDNRFLDRFRDYLYEQGLFDTTVNKYVVNLKTFLTWAHSRGHEIHHTTNERPTHTTWQVIDRINEPLTLTLAELEKIESLNITQALIDEKLPAKKKGRRTETVQALSTARDIFVFECRTCQRIGDVKKFDLGDVKDGVWHNRVKKGSALNARIKTVYVPFNTTFTHPAWLVLHKHGFKLPDFSEQKVNKHIKTVARLAGITQEVTKTRWKRNKPVEIVGPKCDFITTHTGRRTFITIGLQFMKPKLVKDLAGITWHTLRNYEGVAEQENLIEGLNSIPVSTIMKVG